MAGAILQAWLPLVEHMEHEIWILRMAELQKKKLKENSVYQRIASKIYLFKDFSALYAVESHFDLILLGMKPQVLHSEMEKYICLDNNNLWLTMAAGLPLSWYYQYKASLRILRIMPNLGAQVGQSASLCYKPSKFLFNSLEKDLLEQLMQSIGQVIWCATESQLDSATPITGSGPAYFYLLLEALQIELKKQGFTSEEAGQLAQTTFKGAASYFVEQTQQDVFEFDLAARLRQAVTSKGGVTEAAISLLRPKLLDSLAQAIDCGIRRNRELQHG